MSLPPLPDILSSDASPNSPLARTLAILFEPSNILFTHVVPYISDHLTEYKSYEDLIDASVTRISHLPASDQANFIGGHPRIGEVGGLSALSAAEQAAIATPPAVLARLAHLNALYERRYPGLVYITFVAGRSRAEIVPEMEAALGIGSAIAGREDEPPVETIEPVEVEGEAWKKELDRAVIDVGRIAKARLSKLAVE